MVTLGVRRWETLEGSVQGVGKRRNQDWHDWRGTGTGADPLVLAVADGHGSAVHARSALGARFAVDRFLALATTFGRAAHDCHEPGRLTRLMTYARDDFPRALVHAWRQEALGHWDRNRPVVEEASREPGTEEKLVLYGTTLIGAVLTPWLFVAWQIGDGDLAVVEHDGTLVRPLAPAEEDLGDETESLCGREAWRAMRMHWAPLFEEARAPRLVVLSTDGLSKSFASADGYREFVSGLAGRLAEEGSTGVREALPDWLTQASRYSGDDTTLAAAVRPDTEADASVPVDAPEAARAPAAPGAPGAPEEPGEPGTTDARTPPGPAGGEVDMERTTET
ncbi:PP2C family serine/threonine-protein phosphatase [Streptomyces sp. NRRL WC-3744]|uniref:PP2C family serine/threonine-protein phosphatase n=1 Tax=Streptomyces sp. NRRL WC-3744 TaxID=1463935 RepID=UPI000997F74C|nr:PP2C family serine/threonine-protein phosphatase [Streptomyces sp. NRRL WC-3744]